MMPCQCKKAMLLLRISSTHKLDYLLRCVRPAAMHSLAKHFDSQLLQTFIRKNKLESQFNHADTDVDTLRCQIQAPISKNGMGITSAESNMHIAYVSSLAATIQSSQSLAAFNHRIPSIRRLQCQQPPST